MSLFLGKIHYWLFNKIVWFEGLETEAALLGEKKGIDMKAVLAEISEKYGDRLPNKPLEEIIDTGNIHGWLQEKIHIAEGRMAALTKVILENDKEAMTDLEEIYAAQGIKAAGEVESAPESAEELFNCMNDYILDGMPCDRVNEIIESSKECIEWDRRICVHKAIWENTGVDVECFYKLRDLWIKEFINKLNPKFAYVKDANGRMFIKTV